MKPSAKLTLAVLLCSFTAACATEPTYPISSHPVDNSPGRGTLLEDPGTPGRVAGIGIESQDVISMTDKMVRDMLATPILSDRKVPPRIIIDAEYFKNEGSSRINKNMITDRLRVELSRAAEGKMVFAGRHYSDMVARERSLKRDGVSPVDSGTTGLTATTLGGDFRLGGRITTLDAVNSVTGVTSRTHQIIFEMVELETGRIVWSGIYEFKKSAWEGIVYR